MLKGEHVLVPIPMEGFAVAVGQNGAISVARARGKEAHPHPPSHPTLDRCQAHSWAHLEKVHVIDAGNVGVRGRQQWCLFLGSFEFVRVTRSGDVARHLDHLEDRTPVHIAGGVGVVGQHHTEVRGRRGGAVGCGRRMSGEGCPAASSSGHANASSTGDCDARGGQRRGAGAATGGRAGE